MMDVPNWLSSSFLVLLGAAVSFFPQELSKRFAEKRERTKLRRERQIKKLEAVEGAFVSLRALLLTEQVAFHSEASKNLYVELYKMGLGDEIYPGISRDTEELDELLLKVSQAYFASPDGPGVVNANLGEINLKTALLLRKSWSALDGGKS